ncbi:uncharacterized protein CELE_F55F10.3 [Caenorhabditis elegans]|uniref:Uncharacterized protein n=1 Tax=Caenorhabditis elegans TaxID=6239 RepID=A8WIS8_CAEEL|nr:Uncharacterized protein CELE_F55F10.3 [Caenorhabditis elegans]CCD71894.1 Uncharacterized protein CELE_F55F10.3 [Caenorhabditis elegans]|eukprot:NP_001122781.1 Uncharacterized protein CELE_F55F10.3 [Caenorhabditis elegans]
MNRFGFLFLLHAGLSEAGGGGSSDFLQSTVFLIGIAVFTAIVGGLLVYACLIDIKHWRKSIDGRAQLEFPSASPAEFVLPPIQRTPENLVTPKEPESIKSTRVERSPEEKTLRIVKAMYESSKREIPDSVQKSLQSKNGVHARNAKTPLQTISEKEEPESSKKSIKSTKSEKSTKSLNSTR